MMNSIKLPDQLKDMTTTISGRMGDLKNALPEGIKDIKAAIPEGLKDMKLSVTSLAPSVDIRQRSQSMPTLVTQTSVSGKELKEQVLASEESRPPSAVDNASERSSTNLSCAQSATSASAEAERPPPPDQTILSMEPMLDFSLPCTVDTFFRKVLSDTSSTLKSYLTAIGDIDITVSEWKTDELTQNGEIFSHSREISSKHPPKTKYPGLPKFASATKIQRYDVKPNKIVVNEVTRMSGIPYSDAFYIRCRMVISKLPEPTQIRVQVAIEVVFEKSTWLKGQIISGTVSELKDAYGTFRKVVESDLALMPQAASDTTIAAAQLPGAESVAAKDTASPNLLGETPSYAPGAQNTPSYLSYVIPFFVGLYMLVVLWFVVRLYVAVSSLMESNRSLQLNHEVTMALLKKLLQETNTANDIQQIVELLSGSNSI